jgi:hypothetical protein
MICYEAENGVCDSILDAVPVSMANFEGAQAGAIMPRIISLGVFSASVHIPVMSNLQNVTMNDRFPASVNILWVRFQ